MVSILIVNGQANHSQKHAEFGDLYLVIAEMVKHIKDNFQADGYNLGINCGEAAGQTLPHLHIHLIPRRFGDVPSPAGGIRNFLPNPLMPYKAPILSHYEDNE